MQIGINLPRSSGTSPHADYVNPFVVFHIGGNNFRLISLIKFGYGIVYIRHVLTHKEYDLGKWKE